MGNSVKIDLSVVIEPIYPAMKELALETSEDCTLGSEVMQKFIASQVLAALIYEDYDTAMTLSKKLSRKTLNKLYTAGMKARWIVQELVKTDIEEVTS